MISFNLTETFLETTKHNNFDPFLLILTRSLWLISLAFAVPHGIQGSWQSVMALTFGMISEFTQDIGWYCVAFKKRLLSRIAIGSVSNCSSPDISDDDIGKIGLSQTVSMCALGVSVAALQDRFRDRMRLTVTVMLSLSVVSYVWLALICSEVRGTSKD